MSKNNNPIVAFVGRPNVGKSTLFNRFVGKRKAIESDTPGTTRDRLYDDVNWRGKHFTFVDTAGLLSDSSDTIMQQSVELAEVSIEEADLVVFVVDAREGIQNYDHDIAKKLHKSKKNTILALNKADGLFTKLDEKEFRRLGFPKMIPVSAISGQNSGDLLDAIYEEFADWQGPSQEKGDKGIQLAIIGRPNVGKSTLVNTIIGEKKMIESDISGTTRDAMDFSFVHKDQIVTIIDTAGVRKRSKIKKETVESFALLRALRTIRDSDVVIYLIDATEGIVSLDLKLLGEAKDMGRSIILAVNKIDNWSDEDMETFMGRQISILQNELNFMPWVPVVFISALTEKNVKALLNQALRVYKERFVSFDQKIWNKMFEEAKASQHQLDYVVNFKFEKTNPPVFKIWTRKNLKPHFSHLRYLENKIRDVYPYDGTPIFIDWIKNPD